MVQILYLRNGSRALKTGENTLPPRKQMKTRVEHLETFNKGFRFGVSSQYKGSKSSFLPLLPL